MTKLLPTLLLLASLFTPTQSQTPGFYVPIAYTISKTPECLYERIASSKEHLTALAFVTDGSELKALVTVEGPVAPVDIDMVTEKEFTGHELQMALDRYAKEGLKMFEGAVKPIRFAEVIDFESEVEMYDDAPEGGLSEEQIRQMEMEQEERERRMEERQREEMVARRNARREHVLQEQVEKEFEYDDDFVKLQMADGGRRNQKKREDRGRRLSEEVLMAGEAFEKTFFIRSPGW